MSQNNNKSLYLYTSLIFVVAVLLIIISFFGQSHLDRKQPIQIDNEINASITNKTAILSEENAALLSKNQSLQTELGVVTNRFVTANVQLNIYKKSNEIDSCLINASTLCIQKKYAEAAAELEKINVNLLNKTKKELYDAINEEINARN